MVEKISLNVTVVALNVEHNFLIPCEMVVADATELVVKSLCEEYPGTAKLSSGSFSLMRATDGRLLSPSHSFKQLGIVPGEKFILI